MYTYIYVQIYIYIYIYIYIRSVPIGYPKKRISHHGFSKTKKDPKSSSRRSFSKSLRPKCGGKMPQKSRMVPMANSKQIVVNY